MVLPPEQTVFEALLFSAQLRLPESVPLSEKKRIVEDIISRLGLEGVRNRRIGSAGAYAML